MNKIYALVPLAGVALFAVAYGDHQRDHRDRMDAHRRAQADARARVLVEQRAAQHQALQAMLATREQREHERRTREAREAERDRTRAALEQQHALAAAEEQKLQHRHERLEAELARTQDGLAHHAAWLDELHGEEVFLTECVTAAQANRRAFLDLLAQFEAATKTRPIADSSRSR